MKALTPDSVVGQSLTEVYQHLARKVAAASREALQPAEIAFGQAPEHTGADLAFPCFPLARAWRQGPAQIAQELAAALEPDSVLAEVEAAGPYLNLRLARSRVAARVLAEVEKSDAYGNSERQADQRVMMEYVSPNTNKPLHLGHLRNAVLGRSVANLIESQGAAVWRTDIINDRGIHIAKSMVAYRRFGAGETPESTGEKGDHFVGRYYVRFDRELVAERQAWAEAEGVDFGALDDRAKKKAEERFLAESELMAEARDVLQKWEAEEEDVRALWREMNGWVYDGFGQTYERLGITFDRHYYESDIYQGGREVIFDALERGLFERAENGAIIAPLSKHGKLQDKVVLRADGTGLYITQDINLATIKFEQYGLTRSLYCIGSEQNYYMQQLEATLRLLGFPWAEGMRHLSYGMVYLPEGKMKSREGNVVDADDLVQQVTELARQEVATRFPDLDEADLDRRAEAIALSAISFSLLMVGRDTDIHFDPKQSVAFEGKTGPYLQYAYARVSKILRDAGDWQAPESPRLEHDLEWRLANGLLLYPTVVADAAESLDPSRLTTFLVEQAQTLGSFYHDCRVLESEEPHRSSRLALLRAFRAMLGHGLGLLAIDALEAM